MPVQRKIFRIEQGAVADAPGVDSAREAEAALRHREAMTEIKALRSLIEPRSVSNRDVMEKSRAQIAEVQTYKAELDLIHAALKRTREEIETLGVRASLQPDIARASRELAAIVGGTEQATQQVPQAAEDIDQTANTLSAALKSAHEKGSPTTSATGWFRSSRPAISRISPASGSARWSKPCRSSRSTSAA